MVYYPREKDNFEIQHYLKIRRPSLQVFHPPKFQTATNFKNSNHGNNKIFKKPGKPKESFDSQETVSKEN